MTPAVEQLVREAVELTGATPPDLLDDEAPVLTDEALTHDDEQVGFYLIGIIGGKDVGKSALVNALVGEKITAITSHGPGTETVIAYAHVSQQSALRQLLDREVPGKFRIITHEQPSLRRQVMMDLPDIDSHYESHFEVTRSMLRHMLFPVWVQSIEKYADAQPRQMLLKVAEGNDASNFLFCLSKVDQVTGLASITQASLGPGAADPCIELRDDFGTRVAEALGLPKSPEVFLTSARFPDRYDLPRLRRLLAQQKEEPAVRQSKVLAVIRQDQSLLTWLKRQNLQEKADRLARLKREAEEVTGERLAVPLVEKIIPRIAEDPANRSALADDILNDRVARWPLLNLLHTLLAPLFALIRTMGAKSAIPLQGSGALVEFHLSDRGWSTTDAIQSTFAQLRQSHPALADLYGERKLWEEMNADQAARDLSRRLTDTVERQRAIARDRLATNEGRVAPYVRWMLTVGALLWFPILQPILNEWLANPLGWDQWRLALKAIIAVLGADYLLKSAGFLAIYFTVLWLALRWNTHRRVSRMLARWRMADDPDPELNLASQVLLWVEELTAPIEVSHQKVTGLAQRAEKLRKDVGKAA